MQNHLDSGLLGFFDLNSKWLECAVLGGTKTDCIMEHEPRTHRLFPNHRSSTCLRIPKVRGPLSWRFSLARLFVHGSVSGHGVCTVDLPREPARYRGLPPISGWQALPYGAARQGMPLDIGRRQRDPRLAEVRRFRSGSNRYRPAVVRPRSDWRR